MSQPLLSASSILDAVDLQEEVVPCPEWGGDVLLRQMDAEETTLFTKLMGAINPDEGMFAIVVMSVRGEDRKTLLFTPDQIPALKKKSMTVLNRLQRVALRLNGMSSEGRQELKNDSGEVATGGSPSA